MKLKKSASTGQLETLLHTLKETLIDIPTGPQVDVSDSRGSICIISGYVEK